MSDNKKIVGKPDRIRVASQEDYEVRDLARKFELPPALVKNVIEQKGPMRSNVETYLKKMKAAKTT